MLEGLGGQASPGIKCDETSFCLWTGIREGCLDEGIQVAGEDGGGGRIISSRRLVFVSRRDMRRG